MPARDPQTGQFVGGGGDTAYESIEEVHFDVDYSVPSGDLSGSTGQGYGSGGRVEDAEWFDFDEIIERDEIAHLIEAEVVLLASVPSTSTADGTVRANGQIRAAPGFSALEVTGGYVDSPNSAGTGLVPEVSGGVGDANADDTLDLIGRPLVAIGYAAFSDGATGVGGAGTAGRDSWYRRYGMPEAAPFDVRDDLFLALRLEASNVDDAAIHGELLGSLRFAVTDR